jgi:hypothetical protein
MGRLLMWLSTAGGLFLGWYDGLFSLDWLAWLGDGPVWLLSHVLQFIWWLLLAALALVGIGGAHVPLPTFAAPAPFITHDFAAAFLDVLEHHGGEFGVG